MKTSYLSIAISIAFITINLFSAAQERPPVLLPEKNPAEFSEIKMWSSFDETLCEPEYSYGCGMGDGFEDFAVEEIENYNSFCEDLNGQGWSQYLDLGPAVLFPGMVHDFIMQTGYNDQFVTIWVDFNDDFELTSDEIILFDFGLPNADQFYTAEVEIPTDATPGLHYMRARTNWQATCNDPCASYAYGEAEDYFVTIGTAETGMVEGYVTELDGGAGIEGAEISLDGILDFSTTSGPDGYYLFDYVFVGDYQLSCEKEGYNGQTAEITVEEDLTVTQDFELTHPEINVDPLSISVILPVGGTTTEWAVVENNGDGPLNWSASLQIVGKGSDDIFDLQFEYPVAQGGGEAGIETDGNFIYTTKWNGGAILKYDLAGNFIESFNIPGVSGLRDLAYDGTYFYGGAAIPVVWEMDFTNKELISSFTAPTSVRAIAYNDNEDVFYANNFSSEIVKFDKAGNDLGSFEVGPYGQEYYGFAYDPVSLGGPYLWGYANTGESMNEIIQIQLPSGTETGFVLDVGAKLTGPEYNSAGGLFTHPNLIFGKWTLGGLVQNEVIWGLELADAQTWLWVGPNAGTLTTGSSEDLEIQIDAGDVPVGEYMAEIYFTTYPEVGNPVIEVSLVVTESAHFPCNLDYAISCTNAELSWSLCPAESPPADSFYVYRNDVFIKTVFDTVCTDVFLIPEDIYQYKVSAFYDGIETVPSLNMEASAPMPENLEPLNLHVDIDGSTIYMNCDPPAGCLTPPMYHLYQDGVLFASNPEGSFQVDWEVHEYYTTAQYYFGESEPSNTVLFTAIVDSYALSIHVFPNPVRGALTIENHSGSELEIQLCDYLGKLMNRFKGKDKNQVIDVSGFEAGVYFLMIRSAQSKSIRKIIVM